MNLEEASANWSQRVGLICLAMPPRPRLRAQELAHAGRRSLRVLHWPSGIANKRAARSSYKAPERTQARSPRRHLSPFFISCIIIIIIIEQERRERRRRMVRRQRRRRQTAPTSGRPRRRLLPLCVRRPRRRARAPRVRLQAERLGPGGAPPVARARELSPRRAAGSTAHLRPLGSACKVLNNPVSRVFGRGGLAKSAIGLQVGPDCCLCLPSSRPGFARSRVLSRVHCVCVFAGKLWSGESNVCQPWPRELGRRRRQLSRSAGRSPRSGARSRATPPPPPKNEALAGVRKQTRAGLRDVNQICARLTIGVLSEPRIPAPRTHTVCAPLPSQWPAQSAGRCRPQNHGRLLIWPALGRC